MVTKLYHFLVMARRTEPAAPATKGQKIFMMAVGAFYASEALVEISTFKIFSHYMGNDRTVKPILLLEMFCKKMIIE